jgi:hypothetical protein
VELYLGERTVSENEVVWIDLAQDLDKRRAVVNTVINLRRTDHATPSIRKSLH